MAPTRILVVEDEDNIAYVVEAAFRVHGFEVARATTDRAALAAVASDPPDLSLRDGGNETPVLFLTARDGTDERLRGLTIGGDDYVTKPFSIEGAACGDSASPHGLPTPVRDFPKRRIGVLCAQSAPNVRHYDDLAPQGDQRGRLPCRSESVLSRSATHSA